jgi:hypothetical protein
MLTRPITASAQEHLDDMALTAAHCRANPQAAELVPILVRPGFARDRSTPGRCRAISW